MRVTAWHERHGRHDLPWQNTRDPYRIWLSEVMLQQTQVAAVIGYYQRFLAAFPDIASLADASIDAVYAVWSGLGYYRRARHLHAAATIIVREHGGAFPRELAQIAQLPGIGRSTAAAIAAFAFGAHAAILDGNVRRVLARHRGIDGFPGDSAVERKLWSAAEALLPDERIEAYTQAMMDLGATVCVRSRPRCDACPAAQDCVANNTQRVHELPTPRPPRTLPQRTIQVAVLEHHGAILFERRGATGVWSGLWSLPEFAPDEDILAASGVRYGVEAMRAEPLPAIEHGFTHYHLTMLPRRVALAGLSTLQAPTRVWWTIDEALAAGLPAPVKRLLRTLQVEPMPLFE